MVTRVNNRDRSPNEMPRSPNKGLVGEEIQAENTAKEMNKTMKVNEIVSVCDQLCAMAERVSGLACEMSCNEPDCVIEDDLKETYAQFALNELEQIQVMVLRLTDLLAGDVAEDAEDTPQEEGEEDAAFAQGELTVEKKPAEQEETPEAPKVTPDKSRLEISKKAEQEKDAEESSEPAEPAVEEDAEEEAPVSGMSDSVLRKLISAIAEALGDKPYQPTV